MKENFALLFRMDSSPASRPSPEQMKSYMISWMEWINGIQDSGKLVTGNHFATDGMVVKAGQRTESGPYHSDGVSVAGYIIIEAEDPDEAFTIAKKCPILNGESTSVEIRALAIPG